MLTVALTGGIGSGKSEAARAFASLGVPIVDLDLISHQLTGPKQALVKQIASQFGQEYITEDGALDRHKMRQLVFNNPECLRQLNAILHPAIQSEAVQQLQSNKDTPYTLLVIPLLDKKSLYYALIDYVLVIDCDEQLQIERVKQRNQLAEDEILNIIRTQISRKERIAMADDVINNTENIHQLHQEVKRLHTKYKKLK
jgi:dephospho-CoA kinase